MKLSILRQRLEDQATGPDFNAALEMLPIPCGDIIELCFKGFTEEQIAEEYLLTIKEVRSAASYGRRLLTRWLNSDGEFYPGRNFQDLSGVIPTSWNRAPKGGVMISGSALAEWRKTRIWTTTGWRNRLWA